jgi:putative sigma-54 modulation protein
MKTHIHAKGFDLTDGIRSHIDKRIHFYLSRMQEHIMSIDVHLADINGPKGGIDKQCKVLIHSKNITSITIRDTKDNLYEAIDHAINRASHSLVRKITRVQKLSRITRRMNVFKAPDVVDVDEDEDAQEHYHFSQ